jgi:hypothetical protein
VQTAGVQPHALARLRELDVEIGLAAEAVVLGLDRQLEGLGGGVDVGGQS